MDNQELFLSCRRGDLFKVQYLVEQKEVDLNCRDKWDSSPLYYACLCGHEDLVKYMLEYGAKCEANTFDGERCLYGALNDNIKKLLKTYKQVTSATMRRDGYTEFLRRLFDRGLHADIMFVVHGEMIPAHRAVLLARSSYFMEMLNNKWRDRSTIHLTNKLVIPWAFKAVLGYLYTGSLEVHVDHIIHIVRLVKQCKLDMLMEQIEEKMKQVISFESSKPGVNITVLSLEPDIHTLQNDLGSLADHCLPIQLCNEENEELPFPEHGIVTHPDIIFSVEGKYFSCHKAFFCGRSDYYKALIEDHFGESLCPTSALQTVTLHNVSVDVFLQVLYYIYQDSCLELTEANVYDVLCVADLYLLPGLKRQCASMMENYLDVDNIISILRTAQLYNLPRLEDQCAEFLSNNIEKMVQCDDFASFIKEDAEKVQDRQETDSIPIIDDIRFHITNFVQTFSDMYEADQKLSLIDAFLDNLQLEA